MRQDETGQDNKQDEIERNKTGQGNKVSCPVESTLAAIGGRWKVLILRELFQGVRRFGELHRGLHGITQKMLTQQLRELEQDGLVHRQVYQQIPPKVEYSLTPLGNTLKPVLDEMHQWGVQFLRVKAAEAALDQQSF